jgi:hypothetical protein
MSAKVQASHTPAIQAISEMASRSRPRINPAMPELTSTIRKK